MYKRSSLSGLYLLMLLLIGLGYIGIMPLFEGIDENAHFSSMRQIADTKTLPVYGKSYADREVVEAYHGPIPYGSLHPPFDTGMVYSKFFKGPELVASYLQNYRQPHPHASYAPSGLLNWQAQHPPLYYLIMAPLEKATDRFSLVTQILWLRLISYLIALVGVAFGLLAIKQPNRPGGMTPALIGFILYPILLPGFFPEFARMGNDSLCIFWTGLIAWLVSLWLSGEHNRKLLAAIGIVLGLGLLTKAFFVPIAAVLVVFLALRTLRHRSARDWLGIVWMLLLILSIGVGWYIYQTQLHGNMMAGDDDIRLASHGGLVFNLEKHLALFSFMRGIVATFISWIWAGTWSLTRPSPLFYLPLLLLVLWVIGAYLLKLKRRPVSDPIWLPVWLFLIFGAGLTYHVLVGIALIGSAATGGWYLHILMPWVAPALGVGICSIWQYHRVRPVFLGLCAYAVLFQGGVLWAQFAMFTGCAWKGDTKYYVFPDHSFCFAQAPRLVNRLVVLGWPWLAAFGFGGGILCGIWLFIAMRKVMTAGPASPEPLQSHASR